MKYMIYFMYVHVNEIYDLLYVCACKWNIWFTLCMCTYMKYMIYFMYVHVNEIYDLLYVCARKWNIWFIWFTLYI